MVEKATQSARYDKMLETVNILQRGGELATSPARICALVDQALAHCEHPGLLEYRQFLAALSSGRPLFAGTALERLVGRCWNELSLSTRAQLLALAQTLRQAGGQRRLAAM
jgi:hypothetical protein